MSSWKITGAFAGIMTLALLGMSKPAFSQSPEAFFKGRQLRLIIGHSAGGDYDMGARLMARYLPKYLPGEPVISVQSMMGAASVTAANYLYEAAPRDGSVIGSFSRNLPVMKARGLRNLKADMSAFQWLGATSIPGRMCLADARSKIARAEDVFQHEMVVAGSGAGSAVSIVPAVTNALLGTKFRIIEGYRGLSDMFLAMQRGEIEGMCIPADYVTVSQPDALKSGSIRVLFTGEEEKSEEFPGVPTVYSFAKTEEQKQMLRLLLSGSEFGRPYVYPPGVPAPIVAAMRKAFASAAADEGLIEDARRTRLDMRFTPPEELEKRVAALAKVPQDVLERAEKIFPVTN
jgi:tripartite-type tricarboxylate transporter receptor subunit TctC